MAPSSQELEPPENPARFTGLKAWGRQGARRRGAQKAIIALVRRLAVVMHRMWINGAEFRWRKEKETDTAAA
jgi:transposase